MTDSPPPLHEALLMRILVAVDCHERTAVIHFEPVDDALSAEAIHQTIKGASLALAQSLALPETRKFFGERDEVDRHDHFEMWRVVPDMDEATHAFIFDVSQSSDNSDEYLLDFDVVVGDRDDSFPDLKAASAMLARFIKALPTNAE